MAYRWPRAQPVSGFPDDIVALCPSESPLELAPRVTGYICRGRVALDDLEDLRSEIVAPTPVAREHGLPPLSHWRSVLQQQTLDERMAQSRAQLPWVRFLGMAWIWRSLGIPESVCIVCMSMRMCVHLCVWVHM